MDDSNHQGWIKLHRCVMDSQVWAKADLFMLWTYCLLRANHNEKWVSVDGITEPVKLFPGQFITGRYTLHKGFYGKKKSNRKSPLTVWRWLQLLEKMQNLNIKTNNKYSIVTICNWNLYQNTQVKPEQQNEQQMNNRRTTDEHQMNTDKNVKNVKNDNKTTLSADADAFDVFWKAYPGKKGGGKAKLRAKWKKDMLGAKAEHVMAILKAEKRSEQWTKESGQFIPLMSTWLNQQRWDCDITDIQAKPARKERVHVDEQGNSVF